MIGAGIESVYPLSPMQQGMLFHSLSAPETGAYFEQLICEIRGELDVVLFERAWNELIRRNAVLRTSFAWKSQKKPLQVVEKAVRLHISHFDWQDQSAIEKETSLESFLEEDRRRGFNLAVAPLIRLALIRLEATRYYFVMSHHHILMDGWSLPLLMKELSSHYNALHGNRVITDGATRPYKDFISWLQRQDESQSADYWRRALSDFSVPTPFGIDHEVQDAPDGYRMEDLALDDTLSASVFSFARASQVTVGTLFQAAWALVLSRYGRSDDVLFGVTVSGRPPNISGVEKMIGLFINTLPVRVSLPEDLTITDWIKILHEQQSALRRFEHAPLFEIQRYSAVPPGRPLFESLVVVENYPIGDAIGDLFDGLKTSLVRSVERTNYPLTLVFAPSRRILIQAAYETRRFEALAIRRMLGHLRVALAEITARPLQRLGEISLPTTEELVALEKAWRGPEISFGEQDLCVGEWFDRVAVQYADLIAVQSEGQTRTYRELREQSSQVARYLRSLGVGPEKCVAVCGEHSLTVILGILGVMKAGGAFLPLDPNLPRDRLAWVFEDAGIDLILAPDEMRGCLPELPTRVVYLESDWPQIAKEDPSPPTLDLFKENLAYVIYTSGSTGRPKGVMLTQGGLTNALHASRSDWGVKPGDKTLHFSSLSFDAGIQEILLPLLSGATLCSTRREKLLDPKDLVADMKRHTIALALLPPPMLSHLPEGLPDSLQTVVSAGERCSWAIADRYAGSRQFFNGYGPTETTIAASWCRVGPHTCRSQSVPLGRPLQNIRWFVLDMTLHPAPVGVPGELFVAGAGVARGYVRHPELTAERFVPDPFSGIPGSRMFRTGDLVRTLPDGTLEFLGRLDHQVKLRGYRIELGEVETALRDVDSIQDAVVGVFTDASLEPILTAFVVARPGVVLSTATLLGALRKRLPDYMVPSAFYQVLEFPRLPSGKIDRRALSPESHIRLSTPRDSGAPTTLTEQLLANVWTDILSIEGVGSEDNFFVLGGHSLRATQLVTRIREIFEVEIGLRAVFDHPTLAEMARLIDRNRSLPPGDFPVIAKRPNDADLPLSYAQQRMWFLEQLSPGGISYNVPSAIRLQGHLDVAVLRKVIQEVVKRHETLRTTFRSVQGKATQRIAENLVIDLPERNVESANPEETESLIARLVQEEIQKPFDLQRGPMMRLLLLKQGESEHLLILTFHHIVADGWSVSVFAREVTTLYDAFSKGEPSPLAPLSIQYVDYAYFQREWFESEAFQLQINHWQQTLSGAPGLLELPTDHPRPAMHTSRGSTEVLRLPRDLSDTLNEVCRQEGVTLFMFTLAGFAEQLHRYSGQDDLVIGSPVANRKSREIEKLIGFFVNTLPLRIRVHNDMSVRDLLSHVRSVCLDAYDYQDAPFEKLVEVVQPIRDLSHPPIFQVAFVFQNVPHAELHLPGLTISIMDAHTATAKYDLTMTLTELPEGIRIDLEYNTDLFDRSTVRRFLGHYRKVLEEFVGDVEQPVKTLALLEDDEQEMLLRAWNATASPFPDNCCVPQVFEEIVRKQPDAPAVEFESCVWTYDELNRRSNQLASYLRRMGVGPELLVGICLDRSPEMIASILAVMKAGGAFLPLDPSYPAERLEFMIADSNLNVLVTRSGMLEGIGASGVRMVDPLREWDIIAREADDNLSVNVLPENLAYAIYTSGSTGKPKGTLLQHRGLCNLSAAQIKAFGVNSSSRVLQFSSLSFDASVWEIVMALLAGGTLVLASRETLAGGPGLLETIRQHRITTLTMPPSVLAFVPADPLPDLQTLIVAGEKCPPECVAQWSAGRAFFNAYGPTETTVCATIMPVTGGWPQGPPIGRPIANTKVYLLDGSMLPVPVGVPGELYVGGVGLARGYIGRPDLTADRFIPDPFDETTGGRLYRTGDRARYLPDGSIDFLGRADTQVKVRGFRIELGEIETILELHPDITEAVVSVRDEAPGGRRLVAYVCSREGSALTVGEIRAYLRERIPEYMVPSFILFVDAFPLTPSGKINRDALPAPDTSRPDLKSTYVPPRSVQEEKLAEICGHFLKIEKVGVYDNFFELGGHSLLATQVISRVHEEFQVDISVRTLFERPTIAGLAESIENEQKTQRRSADFIQEKMSEIDQMSEDEIRAMIAMMKQK